MKTQSYLTAAFACFSALYAYINHLRGDVDMVSFMVSKLSYHLLPPNIPQNNSADAQLWRARFKAVAIPMTFKPNVGFVEVLHDGVVSGEFRRIRIYNSPADPTSSPLRDVLIFYYGGGFVIGSLEENDALCRTMAKQTNFIVVAVEYSLAPEYVYPRGFDDAFAGLRWTRDNIAQYGGNPERIFVSGESAGGNLAASVTARNLNTDYVPVEDRVNIIGALLVYPGTSGNYSLPSYTTYDKFNGILTTATVKHWVGLYRGGVNYGPEEYSLYPLYTPEHILAQFPPTEVVVAEYDVLQDDSVLFVERLQKVGVPVHMSMYKGAIHGFFGRDAFPASHRAVVKACRMLTNIAHTGKLE